MDRLNPHIPIYYNSPNLKYIEEELRPNFSLSEIKELLVLIKMKEVTFLEAGNEICRCICLTPENNSVEWKMLINPIGFENIVGGTYSPINPGIPFELEIYKD